MVESFFIASLFPSRGESIKPSTLPDSSVQHCSECGWMGKGLSLLPSVSIPQGKWSKLGD